MLESRPPTEPPWDYEWVFRYQAADGRQQTAAFASSLELLPGLARLLAAGAVIVPGTFGATQQRPATPEEARGPWRATLVDDVGRELAVVFPHAKGLAREIYRLTYFEGWTLRRVWPDTEMRETSPPAEPGVSAGR